MFTNRWIDKENAVYKYNAISLQKEGISVISYNMDGPGGCYAKW
jgi:hypothetical protein